MINYLSGDPTGHTGGFEIYGDQRNSFLFGAADLYRSLRKNGITIRKSNDCLIAYYAISFAVSLVHTDRDVDLLAKHSGLKVLT